MNFGLRLKLSIMMVLQYAVWGAWAVPLASYMSGPLGFDGASVGWVYSTTAIAAIISPFFIGMVADRYFSTERCLGVFHLIGALFLYLASKTGSGEVTYLFSIMLLYSLCYMPTIALTNSLSFRNMSKPDQQFPGVRVFGTIGWILIGWVIGFKLFGLEEISAQPLLMASGLSVALGIFCFFLPHTPPMETASDVLGILTKPLGMLKDRAFAIFVVVSFLISIVLAFYYQLANPFLHAIEAPNPQALQTIGQLMEMILLPFLPWFIYRLGIRWTIMIGMVAWCIRYLIFSTGSVWPVALIGLPLHGVCFDFFFVTSQIYVDEESPDDIRASAQGFLALVTLGLGMFIGNLLAGSTVDSATVDGVINWTKVWLVPSGERFFPSSCF
ncbi:MAG: putative nucleoside transporter YegT [Candidatus Hinthialibacteria bacterium OLB16]|nr:MAG: putative nucleoside transporter YegT [Candidatus Hinthialibacteria bacterium OLB16]